MANMAGSSRTKCKAGPSTIIRGDEACRTIFKKENDVEITIGVQNQSRELTLETQESSDDVAAKVTAALENSKVLELTDDKGRRILLPTASIGYIEIGSEEQRPVGFGAIV